MIDDRLTVLVTMTEMTGMGPAPGISFGLWKFIVPLTRCRVQNFMHICKVEMTGAGQPTEKLTVPVTLSLQG